MKKGRNKRSLVRCLILLSALLFLACPLGIFAQSADNNISIDSSHKYQGMDAPFAKGYEPSVRKNEMTLVVPFVSDAELDKNRITVGIDFESGQDSPFYYKNYRKQVKRSGEGVFLYKCRLKLKKDRMNGQYPLHLWAEGKSGGSLIRQEFTIYVEITDGKPQIGGGSDAPYAPGEDGKAGGRGNLSDEDLSGGGLSNGNLPGDESLSGDGGLQSEDSELVGSAPPSAEEKNSQPRLIICQNSLQGNALEAGTSTVWNVSVQNCSSRVSVENIKITLVSESKDIIFEKNAWYFEKVSPKKTMELSQNLTVAGKASAEPAAVQFQIEYEDAKGGSYTTTEEVRILVRQPQQAGIANLSFPEQVYATDTEFLNFQVQNTGLSTIYNVTVRLEAKGLFPQSEVFLGNIEGGSSADGEQKVFVGTLNMDEEGNISDEGGEKYGDTSGVVILSYENEQGEVTEQKLELHTSIQQAKTVELSIEEQKPKSNQWWITIVFFVISALLLVIVWLYLRMKHYQGMGRT